MMYKHAQYKNCSTLVYIYMPYACETWVFRGDKLSEFMKYAIHHYTNGEGQTGVNPPVGSVV